MSNIKPNSFSAVMVPWKNAQEPMEKVVRWGNFPAYGQTLLKHNNSVPVTAVWVLTAIRGEFSIDETLLLTAFTFHDHGEPGSGGDEHAGNKTPGKEIREWEVFMEDTQHLPEPMRLYVRKAFLLQYVRKTEHPDKPWPYPLVTAVAELRVNYIVEPAVFDLIEWIDYLMSAVDGASRGIRNQEEGMLEHCFGNYAPRLDALVREFPGFSSVWNPSLRTWIADLVRQESEIPAFVQRDR